MCGSSHNKDLGFTGTSDCKRSAVAWFIASEWTKHWIQFLVQTFILYAAYDCGPENVSILGDDALNSTRNHDE
jgi:hypothetical protein